MTPDPDLAGPPEYQPDEDELDTMIPEDRPDEGELTEDQAEDIGVLYAAAAYELTTWEWIREQEEVSLPDGKVHDPRCLCYACAVSRA